MGIQGTPVSLSISAEGQTAYASGEEQDTLFVISIAEKRLVREIKTAKGAAPDAVFAIP